MSREFTMGARLTLTDDFTSPIREALRATDQFRQATMAADNGASQLARELHNMNDAHREVNQAARQASQALENASQATNHLGNEQQDAQREVQHLASTMQHAGSDAAGASRQFQTLSSTSSNASQHMGSMSRVAGGLRNTLGGLPGIIAAVAGSMAVVGGYNWLIESNAQMEQYQNTLTTVLGSQKKAVDTLAWANKFAAQTPFEIPQIVEATTVMSSYGMNAQKTLGVVGDMASVMGKDLMQAVEAVADAQTGELERLKEFGITKKMIEEQANLMGKLPFDKKGSVRDQLALNDTIFAIMKDRFAGGMAVQAQSFKGMISNVQDFVATFGRTLGKPLFDVFKAQLTDVLAFLNKLSETGATDRLITQITNFARNTAAVFTSLYNILAPLFTVIFGSLANVLTPVITLIGNSAPVFKALGVAAQFVSDTIVKGWGVIGPIVEGVGTAWLLYGAILLGIRVKTMAVTAALAIQKGALFAYRAAVLAVNVVMMLLRGQFIALWIAMLTNPINLVITAIGLLIGVGILLYRHWDKVKAVFTATFGFMAPYLAATKNAFISFGQTIKNSIGPAMDWISQKFAAAKSWGSGVLDALGPIGTTIRNSFTTIGNTIATLSPLIARLGLSFLGVSGPVGWVIAAVISLGAFLYKLVNNNEGVKASLLGAWNSIKAGVQPVLEVFGQMASTFASMLMPAIQEFATAFATLAPEFTKTGQIIAQSFVTLGPSFQQLGAAIAQLVGTVLTLLPQLLTPILQLAQMAIPLILQSVTMVFPVVMQIIATVVPAIMQLIMTLIPIILQIAMQVIPLILQAVQLVFPLVMTIIQTVIPIIVQIIMTLVPIIMQIVTTVIPLILQVVQAVFPVIMAIISAAIPVITAILQVAAAIITGVLVPAIQIILQVVQVVFPVIMGIISTAMTLITGIIKTATALLKGDWQGAWSAIKETAVTIMNNIISFFKGIDLVGIGKNIIQGLIDGIGSMAKAAAAKVKEVAGGIKDAVTGFFKIHSPSRVFRDDVGKQLGAGLIIGMDKSHSSVIRAAENMASAAMPNLGAVAGPDLSTQLEVATNMQIPTVPGLNTTLDVGTRFDGKAAPSYAASAAGEVNPAGGQKKGVGTVSRNLKFGDIIINIKDAGKNAKEIAEEVIDILQEKLESADEIMGSADMGVLL